MTIDQEYHQMTGKLAAILSRSGKFIEMELKLMQCLQDSYSDDVKVGELLDQLHTVQKAHMKYVQEEYNSLQIAGQYGTQAKSVFKAIRHNTTCTHLHLWKI